MAVEESYTNAVRYAGEFFDERTGLYYLRARYYDPSTGRFISEDSYWGKEENPLSLNRYTYAHNDPLQFVDPIGHFIFSVISNIMTGVVSNVIGSAVSGAIEGGQNGSSTGQSSSSDNGSNNGSGNWSGSSNNKTTNASFDIRQIADIALNLIMPDSLSRLFAHATTNFLAHGIQTYIAPTDYISEEESAAVTKEARKNFEEELNKRIEAQKVEELKGQLATQKLETELAVLTQKRKEAELKLEEMESERLKLEKEIAQIELDFKLYELARYQELKSLLEKKDDELNEIVADLQNILSKEKELTVASADYVPRPDDKLQRTADAIEQVVMGKYTEKVTTEGTIVQVALGLTGLDLPADIRDLVHDFTHWETSWSHSGETLLDAMGLVPILGAFKNSSKIKKAGREIIGGKGNLDDALKYKGYVRDIESLTNLPISSKQRELLKDALQNNNYTKLTPRAQALHRKDFNANREKIIKEWEQNTRAILANVH
ncbi:RHS repeat-associated core domain-containing protein [Paenibacillus allorhizosphaerae]|uniref:RHS repeat-associated core domain-containing protein n=1 Tax=Paenibacillus allorhizosphaerae TaxID=2849866 RepID=A0ABN7U030_9BACL|nr:RHS repeat-associated core domain-containing protein [Paenibacillus allorhizosphaerae]CAG7658426.1 hypothetical protein PAECIP111802_07042 [Paenibacillus allorhizosphaerae]